MGVTLISLSTIYLVYERLWPRAVGGGLAAMGPACNRSICPALARSSGDAAAARVEERDSLQEHEFAFLPRRRERALVRHHHQAHPQAHRPSQVANLQAATRRLPPARRDLPAKLPFRRKGEGTLPRLAPQRTVGATAAPRTPVVGACHAGLRFRDVVQPPVIVTAALKRK